MKKLLMMCTVAALSFVASETYAQENSVKAEQVTKTEKTEKKKGGGHFSKVDKDGDGSVSKKEFMAMHEEKFNKIDSNNDGQITKDEMKAAHEKYKGQKKEKRSKSDDAGE